MPHPTQGNSLRKAVGVENESRVLEMSPEDPWGRTLSGVLAEGERVAKSHVALMLGFILEYTAKERLGTHTNLFFQPKNVLGKHPYGWPS